MKVWLVLALLAMGLGCSEEPPEPWSAPVRAATVEACAEVFKGADSGVMREMTENDIMSGDLCRCVLYNLESQYTESDLTLLSPDEMADAGTKATVSCMESMLG